MKSASRLYCLVLSRFRTAEVASTSAESALVPNTGRDPAAGEGRECRLACIGSSHLRPTAAIHGPSGSRSEEHTSELQSLMRISYAVFCLKKNTKSMHKHR